MNKVPYITAFALILSVSLLPVAFAQSDRDVNVGVNAGGTRVGVSADKPADSSASRTDVGVGASSRAGSNVGVSANTSNPAANANTRVDAANSVSNADRAVSSSSAPLNGADRRPEAAVSDRSRSSERDSGLRMDAPPAGYVEGRNDRNYDVRSDRPLAERYDNRSDAVAADRDVNRVDRQPAPAAPADNREAKHTGVVTGVDNPDNCLRIRREPNTRSDQVGCAQMGEKLTLSGKWSEDARWLQLNNGSWVFARQVDTDLRAPRAPKAASNRSEGNRRVYRSSQPDTEEYTVYRDGWSGSAGSSRNYTDTGIVYGPGANRMWGGPIQVNPEGYAEPIGPRAPGFGVFRHRF